MFLYSFLAAVFLYAAVTRAFQAQQRRQEMEIFGLPPSLGWGVVASELVLGGALLHPQYRHTALLVSLVFLTVATIIMVAVQRENIARTVPELSTYQPTAMSVTLHVTFIVIMIHLLRLKRMK
jgi:uncharacterized membrane protein YphA (DoxX/SURF4 family)